MAFQPQPNQELMIDGVQYRVAEHPHAPGMAYGQEGRQATVFELVANEERRALKSFKSRFRVPSLVSLSGQLAPFAELPGLRVCLRTVLTPRKQIELLRDYPDLTYAVLMPWVEGPTWTEVLLEGRALTPEQSLTLARALADTLSNMEEHGLAHCDLSAPNLILPGLAAGWLEHSTPVELVDVEQMYGPDLRRPEALPSGSPGYAHREAHDGIWSSIADRFAGTLLIAEMLGWCDPRVRQTAWGDSYFDPDEMQQDCEAYRVLSTSLRERWGIGVAQLVERAWQSDTLAECPTFGDWLVALPDSVAAVSTMVKEPLTTTERPVRETQATIFTIASSAPGSSSAELPASHRANAAGLDDATGHLFSEGLAAYQRGEWSHAVELLTEVVHRQPHITYNGQLASVLLTNARRQLIPSSRRRLGWATWGGGGFILFCSITLFASLAMPQDGPFHAMVFGPTPTPTATVTPTYTSTPTITATSTGTSIFIVTATHAPTDTATVTPAPSATSTPLPTDTSLPPTHTQAPSPRPTSLPTKPPTRGPTTKSTIGPVATRTPQALPSFVPVPEIIDPTEGAVYDSPSAIVFRIKSIAYPIQPVYYFEIDKYYDDWGGWGPRPEVDDGGVNIGKDTSFHPSDWISTGLLRKGGAYRIRVFAHIDPTLRDHCCDGLNSDKSPWRTFSIRPSSQSNPTPTGEPIVSAQLAAPMQLSPDDGATLTLQNNGYMQWSEVPGAAYYVVEYWSEILENPKSLSTPTPPCTNVKPCQWRNDRTNAAIHFPASLVRYHWRVWAVDSVGQQGPMSGWRVYTTDYRGEW